MNDDIEIPSINTTELLGEQLNQSREYLKESAEKANKASADYRRTLNSINDRITLLSAGSLSLLLTFLGVLVSRSDSLPSLSYKYIVIASFLFLITIVILLTAKWLQALYVFKINHYYYLKDRKIENDTNLRIAQTSPSSIADKNTGQRMKPTILANVLKDMKRVSTEIETTIAKDKKLSKIYLTTSKRLPLFAFISFTLAYASTIYFFLGVILFLNA